MKLTIPERLVLITILPAEGDYTTLKLVRKLKESLSFSEEEHKQLNFRNRFDCPECKTQIYASSPAKCENKDCKMFNLYMVQSKFLTWSESANIVKDVHMGNKAKELLKSTLQKMSDEKKLSETYLDAYEKFVKAIEDEE